MRSLPLQTHRRRPRRSGPTSTPCAEPLEIEIGKRRTDRGAGYTEFRFTGMTYDGSKGARLCDFQRADGKKQLPGAPSTFTAAVKRSVRPGSCFWNERGYAALTFNWGGKWPGRDKFADWGKLTQGNHGDAGAMLMATKPSVRASSWYLPTRISRRALTCLERMDEVDAQRLGIFGVSMGGTIVWPFAAMDTRVKAACAIYGVGWNTYPDELETKDPSASDPTWKPGARAWNRNRVPSGSCGARFCSSTLPTTSTARWTGRSRCSPRCPRTPGAGHSLRVIAITSPQLAGDRPAALDGRLPQRKPAIPALSDGHGPPWNGWRPGRQGRARPAFAAGQAGRAVITGPVANRNPKNRYWRSVAGASGAGVWIGSLPVLDTREPLFAFANVIYDSNVCLSSNLATVIPAELGAARATDRPSPIIDDSSEGPGRLGHAIAGDRSDPPGALAPACEHLRTRRQVRDHDDVRHPHHDAQDWRPQDGAGLTGPHHSSLK